MHDVEALLREAHRRFDALNAQDPRTIDVDGTPRPRELVRANWLERALFEIEPEPSLPLRIASRSQHLARFRVPRSEYPPGREAYLQWRRDLAKMHHELTDAILEELGFSDEVREAVRKIQLKIAIKRNPDVQTMEDALCLAFLRHEFVPFIEDYDDEKVIGILQKTWPKMSPRGHEHALRLPFSGRARELIQRALA